ncbi:MAG: superoxide dismutase [Clostridia bacterium]
MNEMYPYVLNKLPFESTDLEPFITEEILYFHHDKHLKKYIDTLNGILINCPKYQTYTIEKILRNLEDIDEEIREEIKNNAGGVYNHNFYFNILGKEGAKEPIGNLKRDIVLQFGSLEDFKKIFLEMATNLFGSGYTCLVIDREYKLSIVNLKDQETSLAYEKIPVMLIDVWEHAYYLKYKNSRKEYVDCFFNILNFDVIEQNYNNILKYLENS